MDIETFSTASQDELITWLAGLVSSVRTGDISLTDESAVTSDDLIFATALVHGLAKENLSVNIEGISDFMTSVDGELFRRGAEADTPVE